MTLYQMKESLSTLKKEISAVNEVIVKSAADPNVPVEDISKSKNRMVELKERYDTLKAAHDDMEETEKAQLRKKVADDPGLDPKKAMQKAKGEFYKAAILGNSSDLRKAYEGLGAIPAQNADLGNGDNLLPTNLASELLTEPFETNSLRRVEPVSNITGLEEAKLDFSIEDEKLEDITDKDTAKEIEIESNIIQYGRFKTKLSVTVKDTVMHGSPFNLAATIENGLRSALAIKEKMRAFAQNPDETHAHMSFYSSKNAIKRISGSNLLDAIIAAWADLPDAFSENATVLMRRTDWAGILRDLANGSDTLYGKKPEDIIGIPAVFNDRAAIPVVGDFRYSKQNYDIGTIYETDKDGKKGEYYFILTAWGDHRIRLKSAFRLAVIEGSTNP